MIEPGSTPGMAKDLALTLRPLDFSTRSVEHTSELQSRQYIVCRLLLGKQTSRLYVRHEARLATVRPAAEGIHHAIAGRHAHRTLLRLRALPCPPQPDTLLYALARVIYR